MERIRRAGNPSALDGRMVTQDEVCTTFKLLQIYAKCHVCKSIEWWITLTKDTDRQTDREREREIERAIQFQQNIMK